tara:strand:- start:173 stop:1039 length:867 start_codon:yes stop_codon:yes gene_type:complete
MIFYRILDNKLYHVNEVSRLGFESLDGFQIPDDYLKKQKFMIFRTAWGIGDWGIISAMPRLLKQKYPECKVYVPSKKLIKNMFNVDTNVVETIFKNNPYVDCFKDYVLGEIFHDHYRIYDKTNLDVPLVEQILKFWQFNEEEFKDSQPEIYWTDEEKKFGDNIIKEYVGDGEFGSLLISDRFGTQRGEHDEETYKNEKNKIQGFLASQQIPIFYYTYKSLAELPFKIKSSFDMRNIDLRIQLYIKSKAKFNISNQCGTNQLMARYSDSYEIQRQFPIEHNFVKGETYL